MYDAEEVKIEDEGFGSRLHSPSMINTSHMYYNNPSYNQAVNFNPSILNLYYGSQYGPTSVSPCFVSNAPQSPSYLAVPGIPQYASSPGFLTGAGFQFTPGSPHLGGLHLHGSFIPTTQVGLPLHAAAIVGDKQKVTELLEDESTNIESRDRWGRVALVYAVLGNHHEIVEILLQAGARPDATDAQKCTPFHYAAYKGNHICIKSLLHAVEAKVATHSDSQGGVWLAQDKRGVTPLHHAAHHTNQKCLQALLKYASPGTLDTLDHKKRTPLHWAAAYGSDENVRLLIKHGANNLLPDQEGKTPLHWAAMSKAAGSKGCVRTLIGAAPSSVNWQDFDGITALHLAVAETRQDAVEIILSVPKCNVDLTDNQFRTALHWACSRGVTSIVGRLLDRGAHLGAVDVYGATPLHYAAQLNHADTVELLVRRPCVRDDPSTEGHTALLWAAARGSDLAITAMVRHGASLNKVDPRGCTPLHIAAGAGHVSTVGVLLRLRAPPDICASDGRTPLLHAAQAGHAQIVKLLAKAGASLDHRDNEGQCALHHAVLNGHLYLAQILIRAGTSVNVQDYSGRTPLHMAAYRGLSDIMFLLLENRGDVNARDHEGQSPLHWAAQQGHLGAVNTLLDFHAYPNYTQTTVNRYTPLDCAYVAEQLEIAQVLMEAGGLSVTKIMDIAALKLQAFIRGYLARKYYRKLKFQKEGGSEDFDSSNIMNKRKSPESISNIVHAVIGTKNSPSSLSDGKSLFKSKLDKGNSISEDKTETKDLLYRKDVVSFIPATESSSDVLVAENKTNQISSPNKTITLRRRSKMIASHIKAGARKKTVRELDLPDLGELGIEYQVSNSTNNFLENEFESDDDYSVLKPAVPNPTLPLGHALFYPRNVVSALIMANVGSGHGELKNTEGVENGKSEAKNTGKISTSSKSYSKESPHPLPVQYVNEKDGTTLSNVNSSGEDTMKSSFETNKGNKMHGGNSNKHESKINKRNTGVTTSKSHNVWESYDDGLDFLNEDHQKLFNQNERKIALEKRLAKSLQVAQEEARSTSTRDHLLRNKRVLSADARKRAEEKWNSKLASLTLQVQRPSSAKSATSFSYNLAAATSPANPNAKKVLLHTSNK